MDEAGTHPRKGRNKEIGCLVAFSLCFGGSCYVLRGYVPSEYAPQLQAGAAAFACAYEKTPTPDEVLDASVIALGPRDADVCRARVRTGELKITVIERAPQPNKIRFQLVFDSQRWWSRAHYTKDVGVSLSACDRETAEKDRKAIEKDRERRGQAGEIH